MAILSMKLCCIAFALLLWTPQSLCKNFTSEDTRELLISVVHLLRTSQEKLERHEFRDKNLGEQMKRLLIGLDKKHRALEPMKGTITRMDERLSNVETVLMQKASEEKNTQKKTNEALDSIQKSIQSLTITVQGMKPSKPTEIDNNLTTNEESFDRRLDSTDAKIDGVMREIENLKNTLNQESLRAMCQDLTPIIDVKTTFGKHISEAEKLLTKYETKLHEYNGTRNEPTDVLSEVAVADEAWHGKMTEVMERQNKEITKIQRLLSDAEGMWKDLPRLLDFQTATNKTLDAIVNATEVIKENDEKSANKVTGKLREMGDRLEATNKDIQQSLTQGNTLTERAYSDVSRSYEALRTELQSLSKAEKVLLQISDMVTATKRGVEHAGDRIIMQVPDIIKNDVKDLNSTFNKRFNKIESTLADNQANTQGNLSSKIETETAQVWRQIGIMHEQLSASRETLNKLSEQTERYINSSTKSIGKVKEEVGSISERLATLEDNLNYALGKLALVTQEFKQISFGISEALFAQKNDVGATQKDKGPGPHNIASEE